jgi:hypothetical protein
MQLLFHANLRLNLVVLSFRKDMPFHQLRSIVIRSSSNNGLRLCRSHIRQLFQILGGSGVDIRRPLRVRPSTTPLAITPASRSWARWPLFLPKDLNRNDASRFTRHHFRSIEACELASPLECISIRTSDAKSRAGDRAMEESEIEEPERLKSVDNVKDLDRAQYENGFQDCVRGQAFDAKQSPAWQLGWNAALRRSD